MDLGPIEALRDAIRHCAQESVRIREESRRLVEAAREAREKTRRLRAEGRGKPLSRQ